MPAGFAPTAVCQSEAEIQSGVQAMQCREERRSLKLQNAVIEPHFERTNHGDLRAATGIEEDVCLLMRVSEPLPIPAAAGGPVELHACNRNRRLQVEVSHPRLQRWCRMFRVLAGRGVLEFDADDEEAGTDGESPGRVAGGLRDRAEKQGAVGECGA